MIFPLRRNNFFQIKCPSVIPSKVKTSLFLKKKLHSNQAETDAFQNWRKAERNHSRPEILCLKDCWKNDCFLKKSSSLDVESLAASNSIFTKFSRHPTRHSYGPKKRELKLKQSSKSQQFEKWKNRL